MSMIRVLRDIEKQQDAFDEALDRHCDGCYIGPSEGLFNTVRSSPIFKGSVYTRFARYAARRRRLGDDRSLLEIFLEWLSNGGAELIIQIIQAIMALFVV